MFFYLVIIFKIEESRIDKIRLLLFFGVDVNEVNLCGRLVFVMVCKNSDECVVRYFVKNGVDLNQFDFFGYNVLYFCFLDYSFGLLDFGVFRSKIGLLKLLVFLMVDINVVIVIGMMVLYFFVQRVKADDIRIMFEVGVNFLIRDNFGRIFFYFSMFNFFFEVF